MQKFFSNLITWGNQNTIVVALVTIVIAFIIAQYFYQKQKTIKKLGWTSNSHEVFSYQNSEPRITITINAEEVSTLFLIELFIWNAGNSPIRENEMSGSGLLEFEFDCDKIFSANIIQLTSNIPNISVAKSDQIIALNFEFLNQNQGVLLHVLAENFDKSETAMISCLTTIVGETSNTRDMKATISASTSKMGNAFLITLRLYAALFSTLSVIWVIDFSGLYQIGQNPFPLSIGLLSTMVATITVAATFLFPSNKVPKKLMRASQLSTTRSTVGFTSKLLNMFS